MSKLKIIKDKYAKQSDFPAVFKEGFDIAVSHLFPLLNDIVHAAASKEPFELVSAINKAKEYLESE